MSDNNQIQLTIPAQHKYLNVISAAIEAYLKRHEILSENEEFIYRMQLGVHEACTNIVDHAYQAIPNGLIDITIKNCVGQNYILIDIFDTGKNFNPDLVPIPEFGTLQIHGFGLHLLNNLIDEVFYDGSNGKNHWRLKTYITPE